jgi:site-specific recombinase XerC
MPPECFELSITHAHPVDARPFSVSRLKASKPPGRAAVFLGDGRRRADLALASDDERATRKRAMVGLLLATGVTVSEFLGLATTTLS